MFARVAAAKGSFQTETTKTVRKAARVSQSEYSAQHPESAQARIFNPPRFSWNIGNVAVHAPNDRNQPSSDRGSRYGATQQAGSLPWPMQAKLEVGGVDDPLEREADRVAEQVMRLPDAGAVAPPAVTGGGIPGVQRKCSCGGMCTKCRTKHAEEEHGEAQRKAAAPQISGISSTSAGSQRTAPPIVQEVLRSPGEPLPAATLAFFEAKLAHDFSTIRVHANDRAAESAHAIQARAYTVGHNIVFGAKQYQPGTVDGRRLLAHELAHVVQQASAPTPLVQRGPGGGQGDQKFFDLSRGPLSDAEKAKLLAVRKSFNLPDTPTPSDTSIVGILITETGEEIPFHSGERGGYHGGVRPADVKGGPGSGTNRINRTHVETWAANAMRKRGLKRAVLLIELEPCAVCGGYGKGNPTVDTKVPGVSAQLPEDAQLMVVDGQSATYFRQTPTDPQKPTRVSPKPPKGQGGVKAPAATDVDPGGAGTGKSPQVKGQGGVKAPAATDVDPGGAGTGKSQQVKGQGGVKAPAATDVDPGSAGKTGATTPAQKTTGTPSQPGRSSGLAIEVGTGIATLGLDWLAAYLKSKVDRKIAARQIDALMAVAKKKINANPDEALKKMMPDPYRTVYAWVYLDSSVITTFGVGSTFEPPTSASAPIIDLSRIDYMTAPVDQSLIESYPKISGGGRHFTVTSQFVIDIPLTTPPLEDLISYAKARNLPLDDLYHYVLGRYQYALSSLVTRLETLQKIREAQQSIKDSYQKLQAQLKIAKKLKDVGLQKSITENLESTRQSLSSFPDREKTVEEIIQKGNQDVKYWEHILNLVEPTTPRP
jgi:Domain of unknown function (DUF4157)